MNKALSFLAGSICGALVGSAVVLLFTPLSGEQLKENIEVRWQQAVDDAKVAMDEKRLELEQQFEQAKAGSLPPDYSAPN